MSRRSAGSRLQQDQVRPKVEAVKAALECGADGKPRLAGESPPHSNHKFNEEAHLSESFNPL